MPKPKKIEVLNTFRDDHLPCVSFKYGDRVLSLWWTDSKTIGALHFPDSPAARAHLKPLLAKIDKWTDRELKDEDFDACTDLGTVTLGAEQDF